MSLNLRNPRKLAHISNDGIFVGTARLHSSNLGENTAKLRGRRGIQGKQVDGSYLPMYFLLNSFTYRSIHSSHYQIPFVLSHPISLSTLQESLPLVQICNSIPSLKPRNCSLYCLTRNSRLFSSNAESSGSDSECEGDYENQNVVDHSVKCDEVEVERICKVINETFSFDRNMEAVLDECKINLSTELVLAVLERFKHARKPSFRFFRWATEQPDFAPHSSTYNRMMDILGKTRQFETMVSILEEMGDKGLLTMDTFLICIKSFAAAKERKKAVGIFDLMRKHKYEVTVETINCLLDALGRAKLGKEAQALFERMEDRFDPNLKTYTVLLSGWCKVKNLMEAARTWNKMIDYGFKPDIVAHNIMLEGLLRCQKRSDAIKLFEVMKSKGPMPNARSYTVLIQDLCKHGKMNEAVAYLEDMVTSEVEPDVVMYTCLMIGFGKKKKMDVVYRVIKDMTEKGCEPDGVTYNALIKIMVSQHMPEDALMVYKKMIKRNCQPSIHTYNMIMKSYFVVRNCEMGCAVWEEMKRKGFCPDENTYTIIIGGLIRLGRSMEARTYLEEMISKGMKAPQLDFNKFRPDLSRAGRPSWKV